MPIAVSRRVLAPCSSTAAMISAMVQSPAAMGSNEAAHLHLIVFDEGTYSEGKLESAQRAGHAAAA